MRYRGSADHRLCWPEELQSARTAQVRYLVVRGIGPKRATVPRMQGGIPRRRNFNRIWRKVLTAAGIPDGVGLHLHDLRDTGSTWSAQSGATLKELMARIGHSSTRAAMIYQHATRDRDHAIAAALDALIEEARGEISA